MESAGETAAKNQSRSNIWKLFFTNFAVVIGAIVAVECAASLYLRSNTTSPIHDPRAVVPQELAQRVFARARLYETQKALASPEYNVDDNGYRSSVGVRDIFAGYSQTDKNIFAFGGSMTFGFGVKDSETWPAQLQRLLPTETKIYNVGQDGVGSFDETYLLVQLLTEDRIPTTAVFMNGGNESCPEPSDRSQTVRELIEQSPLKIAVDQFLHKSSAVALLRRHLSSPINAPHPDIAKCATAFARRIVLIERLLRAYGATSYFVFQPSGSTIPNYKTFRFWSYGNPDDEMARSVNAQYDAYIGALHAAGVEHVVDLRHVLDDAALARQEVFLDHQHPTGAGQAIVADAVARILEEKK